METIILTAIIAGGAVLIVQALALVALVYLHVHRAKPTVKAEGTTANPQEAAKVAFHYGLPRTGAKS